MEAVIYYGSESTELTGIILKPPVGLGDKSQVPASYKCTVHHPLLYNIICCN